MIDQILYLLKASKKMWSNNSTTNGYSSNRCCICYTPYSQSVKLVPNLCSICHASLYASNPMNQWYNNNVLPDNQLAPQYPISSFSNVIHPVNSIFHLENNQQVSEQMAKTEIDSLLLPNPDSSREDQSYLSLRHHIDGCLNHTSGSPWDGNQYQGQFNQMQQVNYEGNYGMFPDQILQFSQGVQDDFSRAPFSNNPASLINASLSPTGASNGSFSNIMNLPREWGLNPLSFPPFQPGNLLEETIGSHSNSTSISSEGTQKLISLDESKKPFKLPPISRQDRVLRYFEKKKTRKYGKKIKNSSRKTYAQTQPRVRGRFARSSQTDTNTTV